MSIRRALLGAGVTAVTCLAAACSGHTRSGHPTAARVLKVGCGNVIFSSPALPAPGYRVVLSSVAVPPVLNRNRPVRMRGSRWRYWLKAAIAVRAGHGPVTVQVPLTRRGREAITWGNGLGVMSALRIAPCAGTRDRWNVYAGGFYLQSPSACLPVTFTVGDRSRTLRFGIGRPCRPVGT